MLRFLQRKKITTSSMVAKKKTPILRKIFLFTFWILFLGVIGFGAFQMQKHLTSSFRSVNIAGNYQHVDSNQLKQIIMPYTHTSFFDVNLNNLKNQIQQMPWVANANIEKVWPSTLNIQITEQIPFAKWNGKNLVTAQGEVFSPPVETFPAGLPRFYAPNGEQKLILSTYRKMNKILMPLNLRVTILQVSPSMSWGIRLSNGVKVVLGRDKVLPRLSRLVAVYPKIVGANSHLVNYIDMRYLNGIAINWQQTTSTSSSSSAQSNNTSTTNTSATIAQ